MNQMPVVKVEIENLKHTVLTTMGLSNGELHDRIAEAIDEAVKKYPWQERIDRIAHAEIDRIVTAFFQYGQGAEAIRNVLKETLAGAIRIEDLES
jgi:hypothetical protein